jgi:hypothetical protein
MSTGVGFRRHLVDLLRERPRMQVAHPVCLVKRLHGLLAVALTRRHDGVVRLRLQQRDQTGDEGAGAAVAGGAEDDQLLAGLERGDHTPPQNEFGEVRRGRLEIGDETDEDLGRGRARLGLEVVVQRHEHFELREVHEPAPDVVHPGGVDLVGPHLDGLGAHVVVSAGLVGHLLFSLSFLNFYGVQPGLPEPQLLPLVPDGHDVVTEWGDNLSPHVRTSEAVGAQLIVQGPHV